MLTFTLPRSRYYLLRVLMPVSGVIVSLADVGEGLHLFGILFCEGGRTSSGKFLVWLVVSVR